MIVGEVRGGEALDMLQAMNTGHDGSLSTAQANLPGRTPPRTGYLSRAPLESGTRNTCSGPDCVGDPP